MTLVPDKSRLVFGENNVNIPAGLKVRAAYDLALYPELGKPGRGVLLVTVIGDVVFKDGTASTGGGALNWGGTEKTGFLTNSASQISSVWAEKHRITTTSKTPPLTDIGVIFDIKLKEGRGFFDHNHWDLTVTKVDKFTTSSVDPTASSFITDGIANLDSQDTTGVNKGASMQQRAIVHEFGHMISYRDEYRNGSGGAEDNPHHLTDADSVMNTGEAVRERHYVFFADWLNKQCGKSEFWEIAARGVLGGVNPGLGVAWDAGKAIGKKLGLIETIAWKVNGSVDLSNALI
jgi:hypothetical protein